VFFATVQPLRPRYWHKAPSLVGTKIADKQFETPIEYSNLNVILQYGALYLANFWYAKKKASIFCFLYFKNSKQKPKGTSSSFFCWAGVVSGALSQQSEAPPK